MNTYTQLNEYTPIPVRHLGDSYTTDYKNYYSELNTVTTSYLVSFVTKVLKAFLKLEETSTRQLDTLVTFMIQLNRVEELCNSDLNKKIDVMHSVEDEVCFYIKSSKGVSMVAIDNDGDIFYSYIGYEKDSNSQHYSYNEISSEIEVILYRFLSN